MALASSVKIEIEGVELKDYISIELVQNIYGINEFTIKARLDSLEEEDTFVLTNSKSHIGASVVITIDVSQKGDGSEPDRIVFKGLITKVQGMKSAYFNNDHIILSGKSPEFLLQDLPGNRSFENKNLKQIVDEVLKPYPRDLLKSAVNPSTSTMFEYLVQYNETNYDFLRRLAKRYGEWMFYDGTEFVFGMLKSKAPVPLMLGVDQTNFNFDIQIKPVNFNYVFHDFFKNETVSAPASKSKGKKQQNDIGGLAHDKSAKLFNYLPKSIFKNVNVSKDNYAKQLDDMVELKEKAQAAGISTLNGSSVNPMVKLGGKVKIQAIKFLKPGESDYGEYIITSVTHTLDNLGFYKNEFTGISAEATVPDYTDPEVSIVCEPQSAIVTDNKDPEKLGRLKVRFDWQDGGQSTPWIRMATPHSGVGRGVYFIPDIDDEVLVGFEGHNPERPFIMGSLYNGKGKPHDGYPSNNNNFKGIMFNGLNLQFDEGTGSTLLETPDKKRITLSDQKKSLKLEDENGNSIELTTSGIKLTSAKDMEITVSGSLSINTGSGIDITAGQNMNITTGSNTTFTVGGSYSLTVAQSASITAGTSAEIKGGASAKLEGAAAAIISGAIVKIN